VLRHYVASWEQGQPGYGVLSPPLAAAAHQQYAIIAR
jgi:hypothetical protein